MTEATGRVGTKTVLVSDAGDGSMTAFESAADGVAAAAAIQQDAHAAGESVRVGLSVGDVATEADGAVTGAAVTQAQGLCATAQPGEILAAQTVRELVRGRGGFVYEPIGDLDLGDAAGTVATCRIVWEPARDEGVSVPFPVALVRGFGTTYVGRTSLLDQLAAQWERAKAGTPGAALLAGEPGVGKTRTASEVGTQGA